MNNHSETSINSFDLLFVAFADENQKQKKNIAADFFQL